MAALGRILRKIVLNSNNIFLASCSSCNVDDLSAIYEYIDVVGNSKQCSREIYVLKDYILGTFKGLLDEM